MGKPTICIGENREADQRLCFLYSDRFLVYLNPNFQAYSSFLCLYRPVSDCSETTLLVFPEAAHLSFPVKARWSATVYHLVPDSAGQRLRRVSQDLPTAGSRPRGWDSR